MENKSKQKIKRLLDSVKRTKDQTKDLVSRKDYRRALIVIGLCALVGGWLLSSMMHGPRAVSTGEHASESSEKATVWTCSMHPQIQLPKEGQCPLCGMDLIPLDSGSAEEGMPSNRRLIMSPDAMKLAEIQTTAVERKSAAAKIRMVGKVEYDETKIAYITAWTGGRIDRLYIDQTGVPVQKGDHMAYLYSPELVSAQEEYLQAIEGVQSVSESHLDIIKSTSVSTVENAREKLRLLGVTDEQIQELEKKKKPSSHMTVYATANGIVVNREVQEGDYVKTGSRIYSIVDLSQVWIKLDAYEADLQWLRYGQDVAFEAEAYPGEILHGRISFVDPILDQKTRTVKVRVIVDNEKGLLKPGMFVRAVVSAQVIGSDKVMDTYLDGKWMCPMHPEVISEEAGACPICEMPLVTTEKMGYTATDDIELPLVIPATAVLKTGKRAVVYVRALHTTKPTFEGREIVLGARAGDDYIVKSGLAAGEIVVTNGNFKIDSALQIQAKPSMMNPKGEAGGGGHDMSKMAGGDEKKEETDMTAMTGEMAPAEFLEQLVPVYGAYFKLQEDLATDELNSAKQSLQILNQELDTVDMNLLPEQLHADWMDIEQRLQNSIVIGTDAKTLEMLREDSFFDLSETIISLEQKIGHTGVEHFKAYCPMALDGEGASWLQSKKQIMNPYFGKGMQTCGDIKKIFAPMDMTESSDNSVHGGSHVH